MYTPSKGSCFLSRTDHRRQENRRWVRYVRSIPVVNDQEALDVARRRLPPVEKIGVDIFTFHNEDYLITVCDLSGFFEVDRLP